MFNMSARPVDGRSSSRQAQRGRSGSSASKGRGNRSRRSRRKLKHFGDKAGKAEQGVTRSSRSARQGSARKNKGSIRGRSRSNASRSKARIYDVEVSLPDGMIPGSSSRLSGRSRRSRASSIHAANGVAGSSARGTTEGIGDGETGRGSRQADTRADDLSSIQYGVDGRSYEFASVGESGIADANGVLHTLDGTGSAVSPRQLSDRESPEGTLAATNRGPGSTRRGSAHGRRDERSKPSFEAAEEAKRKKRLDFLVEMSREHEEALEALAQELRLIKQQSEKTDEARKQALLRAVEEAREQQAALSASMRRLGYSEGQAVGRAQGLLDGAAAGLSHAVAAHDVASGTGGGSIGFGFGGVSASGAGVGPGNSRMISFDDEEQHQLGAVTGGPPTSRYGTPSRASGRLGSPARSGGHALDGTLGWDSYSHRTPGWVGSPIVRSPAQSVVAPPARLEHMERYRNPQNAQQLDAALLSARLVHWSMSN